MTRTDDRANVPLAVVGMACRLPGADNLDQYWRLLVEGRSAVVELPPDRLDQELYFDPRKGVRNKTYSKLGAILSNRQFNRQACPISEELERSVDIAHLLMCEVAAEAFRHAGLDPFRLPERNVGVFVGHAQGSGLSGDYIYGTCVEEAAEFLREIEEFRQLPSDQQQAVIDELVATIRAQSPRRAPDTPDVATSMIAGTISQAFGLTGPYLAVNSACASSLQAVLLAGRALQLGRVDMAVAAGASDCKGDSLVLFSAAQTLTTSASRPFDADADGLVISEGYVALVLKTLPKALADGDRVLAVIRGMGISSDGKGKSLWAPRKEGQIKAMERAYAHGLEMSELQYVEAHATATQLGDATELNTLAEALKDKLPPGRKIPVTSVKANIGHSLEVAGIAGMIKTILAMQHGVVPPAINIRQLNPKIDWENSPVYVPTQPVAWPAPAGNKPRRGGVNAFGIGGLNMHVVIDEFTESARQLVRAPQIRASAENGRKAPAADDAVAIVGMSCIFPGAKNLAGFWDLLVSGRDPKTHVTPDRWRADLAHKPGSAEPYRSPTTLGGFITDFQYDWRTHKVPPKQVAQADPLQFMLLEAADQAIQDAGYDKKAFDRGRVGVLVGTEFGGDFACQLQMGLRLPHMGKILQSLLARRGLAADQIAAIEQKFGDVLLGHWPALIDESGSFSTSSLASRISKSWDLMGGAAALDAGSTSALAALATSIDMLLAGDVDMMVCASGQRRMGLPAYETLAMTGLLAADAHPRAPFDAQAKGHVPGEGVGVVLLKRLADARRDGDRIHAVIRGIGAGRHDAWGESVRLAIERALANAGAQPGDLALIDADGYSIPAIDDSQAQALVAVHEGRGRRRPLRLGTVVGQIGHTGGASGMATLLKATLEIEHDEMAGTLGLQTPVPSVAQNASVLQAATSREPLVHATPDGRRLAGVSGCAKGLAYHVVLEKATKVPVPPEPPAPPVRQPAPAAKPRATMAAANPGAKTTWKIFRLGGATPKELFARLSEVAPSGPELFATAETTRFTPADRARLAIVAESPVTLAQKLQMAARQIAAPAARQVLEQQGIFYRPLGPRAPRIAFVFSGQGSQYTGMLRELAAEVPAAQAAVREVDTTMARLGYPTFAQMAWDEATKIGTDIWLTQASMLLADRIVLAALGDRGIRPDVVFGHSYGEYVALMAAGAWDFEQAVRVTRARCMSIEAAPSARGAMLATTATPETVAQLSKRFGRPIFVANHNAPDQTVVAGQQGIVEEFAVVLVREAHQARLLPVPCPFHTPIMQDAAVLLARAIENSPIAAPQVPILSVVTNDYVRDPEEIRANLVAHMTQPVHYVDLVRRVVAEDNTVLVEVGPQQALTRLHRRILEGYDFPVIASDNPKRPGRMQIECVQALLECTGALDAKQPEVAAAPVSLGQAAHREPGRHEVLHFDATARRREKMRTAAAGKPAAAAPAAPKPPVKRPEPVKASASAPPREEPARPARPSVAPAPVAPQPAPAAGSAAPVTIKANIKPEELESFLINFVVEQTGYPPEVVELDADLEADLGIDSIKKAQLFGELQEYFDVTPTEDLTLDDFPTLRHVVNFLRGSPTPPEPAAPQAPAIEEPVAAPVSVAAPEPRGKQGTVSTTNAAELEAFMINFVVEQTGYPPEVVELDADLEADLGIDSIKKAQLFGELQEYFDVTPSEDLTLDDFPTLRHVVNYLLGAPIKGEPPQAPVATAPVEAVAASVPPPPAPPPPEPRVGSEPRGKQGTVSTTNAAELEAFMINFVVEQTGYPPEVVELDADLEADLGIDSIKKAQLFGELQEYFDVTPSEDLTLDDFPTLRHVVNYLLGTPVKGEPPQAPAAQPPAATMPAEPVAISPPQLAAPPPEPQAAVEPRGKQGTVSTTNAAELEAFMINFVVEQTGYPPEVVELDADLEADLGIDSIKKAQLFGELQEYFDVTPSEDLTLDDFPTLRHVVNYLLGTPIKGSNGRQEAAADPFLQTSASVNGSPAPASVAASEPSAVVTVEEPRPAEGLERLVVLELSGTPYEMGLEQGRRERVRIRQILRRYADLTGAALEELPLPRAARDNPEAFFAAEELAELEGIADGVGVPLGNILAHNLAMFAELGSGTIHFALSAAQNSGGSLIHGLNEELPLAAPLRECVAPLVQVRRPSEGIPYATLSTAGVAGGLGGINAAGVAVSLHVNWDRQRQPEQGPLHANIVNAVLERADHLDRAIEILRELRGPTAWVACVSHAPSDRVCYATSDAHSFRVETGKEAILSAPQIENSVESRGRLERLHGLLASDEPAVLTVASVRTAFRGEAPSAPTGPARRYPRGPLPTPIEPLGLVIDPAAGDLWVKPGYPVRGAVEGYCRLRVDELFPPGGWNPARTVPPPQPEPTPQGPRYDLDDRLTGPEFSQRFGLRTIESALNPSFPKEPQWQGAALIVGRGAAADALRGRLKAGGVVVRDLAVSEDLETTLQAFQRIWDEQPIFHLFLLSPRDDGQLDLADLPGWHERRYRNAIVPFFLCQRWLELACAARLTNRCTVVAGLNLGGDLGFSGNIGVPESGAIGGLLKSVCIEFMVLRRYNDLVIKLIDAPPEEPLELLAENIVRELAARTIDYEVAFVGGRRYLQNAFPEKAPVREFADVRPGSTWVVTGGARGITAACALELGRRFQLKLHLIGTSPLPEIDPSWRNLSEDGLKALKSSTILQARQARQSPTEAWAKVEKAIEIDRSLRAFAAAGVAVRYHTCDVSDREPLDAVLGEIRRADGPIEGILHGAGIDRACRFEKKRREQVEATFGAKVDGAYHLMTLTRHDPIRHFVAFGSITGRLGGNGQADYGAASEMLCKLIGWYRTQRPDCHAVGFHYHPWDEIGMAIKPETRAVLEMSDAPAYMPKDEGIRHLVREIYAGVPRSEVLITDWDYYQRFYGSSFLSQAPWHVEATTSPDEPRVAQRSVLRTVDAPLPAASPEMPSIGGPVLIFGQNRDAQTLCQRLVNHGVTVHMLPVSDDPADVIAALERVWASGPAEYLFLMTARDEEASRLFDRQAWEQRRWVLSVPYLLAQRFCQLLAKLSQPRRGTIVAATSLGGDFGFRQPVFAPEGGMLAGMLKSLYVEDTRRPQSRIRAKVIEAPADEDSHALAEAICRELAAEEPDVEVSWSAGRRRVVRSVPEPVERLPRMDLPRGGVWVVTGGARGITAAAVEELAKRYGLRLHLLGLSPKPSDDAPWRNYSEAEMNQFKASIVRKAIAEGRSPDDDWEKIKHDLEIHETLQRMTEAGIKVTYHSCDVSDWDALAATLDRVRQLDGPIQGIVHGAGYAKSSRFETVRPDRFQRTVQGKVAGAVALMALTQRDPIHYFVAFGSLSGRFGGNGLSDYAAANEMLAKLIGWYRRQRPESAAACFHWQTWDRIGMAMLSDSVGITKNALKMPFIPPEEGIEHLHQELRAGLPEAEVLITDGYFQRMFYPHESSQPAPASSRESAPSVAADAGEPGVPVETPKAKPLRPLIDRAQTTDAGGLIAEIRFDPAADPFLLEHRLKGKPFLPAVVGLEALAEAAALWNPRQTVVGLSDVEIVNGLMFHSDRPIAAKVAVTPAGFGAACLLTSELRDRKDRVIIADRVQVKGTVHFADAPPALVAPPPGEPPLGWFEQRYPEEALIHHGPAFRSLKGFCCQYDGSFGKILASSPGELAGPRPAQGWHLPLAVLDGCLYACGNFLFIQFAKALEIPHGFDRLQWTRMPREGETCVVRVFFRGREDRHSCFDFTLFGDDGNVLLAAEGYRTVLVGEANP